MPSKILTKINSQDFCFENSKIRIIANRNCPEIKLAGLSVGPFEEGNEYEAYQWVAVELERSGICHLPEEDCLDSGKLFKTQWKERAQTAGQISKLTDNFYARLRRYLVEVKEDSTKTPEKMREYDTVKSLARDIVNSRLRKIVSLSSAPAQTEHAIKNLTEEEKYLYNELSSLIHEWKKEILEPREKSNS